MAIEAAIAGSATFAGLSFGPHVDFLAPLPARSWPRLPVLINRAVRASAGEWVWLTDADYLFPSTAVRLVLGELDRGLTGQQRLVRH